MNVLFVQLYFFVIYHVTCVSLCVLTSVSARHVFSVICFNWHWSLRGHLQGPPNFSLHRAAKTLRPALNREYIQCLYSAMSGHTKRSDMDHAVLPANYTMPAFCFASVHQMAPLPSEVEGIWWGLATHLSTPKGWEAELDWLVGYMADGLST